MAGQQQLPQQTVIIAGRQSQALPALVNCFCFPGLGQLIQGRLFSAFAWWFLHLLGALSILIGIGFILWPIIWIACVIDAARYDPVAAQLAGRRRTHPIVAVIAGVMALIVFVPLVSVIIGSRGNSNSRVTSTNDSTTARSNTPSDAPDNQSTLPSASSPEPSATLSAEPPQPKSNLPKVKPQEFELADPLPTNGEADETPKPTSTPKPNPKLIIEDWRFTTEFGFAKATGEVTNNTASPLKDVVAVVNFYTADGEFVKTSEALISYNPILPRQKSPFEVIDTENPAITKATTAFKTLFGGRIDTMTREDLNRPTPEELAAKQKAADDVARARAEEDARKAAELEAAKSRIWTTADGKYKVEARLVKLNAGTLTLEKKDGNTIDVKMDILCPEDQEFVRQRKWTRLASER